MRPWRELNNGGRLLAVCVFINMYVSIIYVTQGSYVAIFPAIVAAFCGISTYNTKYTYQDSNDINNDRETKQ